MPSMRSTGIEHVAFRLAHLLALGIAHHAVDVDVAERHLARELRAHHDHPGDPEEDDLVAGDEHARGQEERELLRLRGPAERGEGDERRRVPGVEHVRVARQGAAVAGCLGRGAGVGFAAGDEGLAVLPVPRRDLVAPPELARDGPVLDVREPVAVGREPLLGHEAHGAALDRVEPLLGEAAAVAPRLRRRDEPLVGEHRLDDLPGAHADRHRVLVRTAFSRKRCASRSRSTAFLAS
jgi:hypothetical protein